MAFTFRLERVLSVRRIQEEAAREAHARAQDRVRSARQALDAARDRLTSTLEAFDEVKRRDELTSEALYLHTIHLAGLRREIETARAQLVEATADIERTGSELLEAHKRRKSLERHREREEFAWRKGQARKEAKDLDEMVVSRHRTREEESHGP